MSQQIEEVLGNVMNQALQTYEEVEYQSDRESRAAGVYALCRIAGALERIANVMEARTGLSPLATPSEPRKAALVRRDGELADHPFSQPAGRD
ncbi:MAG: hypothetical protein J2P37_00175 [Ktedonobacteraceae bacterium]|nr:hypothetical protein [Ktedonobacteraceae bacterium]